jgi:GT2 family glycosyltransferase
MLGIININYNSEMLVLRLLEDLEKQLYSDWFLVVVDNGSKPGNLENLRKINNEKVHLIEANENLGYAKGNNLGFNFLYEKFSEKLDLVLICNNDIRITESKTFNKVITYFNNNDISFLGPELVNLDGSCETPSLNEKTYLKCLLHFGNNGIVDKIFPEKILKNQHVYSISGAFFFARVKDFISLNLFDPNTFLYYEEEILFKKAKENNLKTFYLSDIKVLHEHSKVVSSNFNKFWKKKQVYNSEIYFLKSILKVGSVKLNFFKIERKFEFFLLRILSFFKVIKKVIKSG